MLHKRRILSLVLINLLGIAALCVVLEAGLRIQYTLLHPSRRVSFSVDKNFRDPLLGWPGTKNFGNPQTKKPKILFIGDSFTAGWRIPQEKMYYRIAAEKLGAEAFAFGGGGYGTFQEFLALDKYIDEIQPNLVVLQVTSNDFINNLWELENQSRVNRSYAPRPYFENGKTVFRFPKETGLIPAALFSYSYLVNFSLAGWDKLSSLFFYSIEKELSEHPERYPAFGTSVAVTTQLISKIKSRCGKIPLIAFPVFNDEPFFSQFKIIFKKAGVGFLAELPKFVSQQEAIAHTRYRRNRTHWTEVGQAACGEYLGEALKPHLSLSTRTLEAG